jgi:ATP-dependent Clp protease adaptor protein ClpS
MPSVAEPEARPDMAVKERADLDPGYLVICWDDPVNTMDYVTHVFQKVFGWKRELAEKRMWEVHNNGKSVLIRESLEKAEYYVHQLHGYSLHASMEKDSA